MSRDDVRTNLTSWEAGSADYQDRNASQLNRWDRLGWGTWDIPEDDIGALGERMAHYGVEARDDGRTLELEDPWANLVRVATPARG